MEQQQRSKSVMDDLGEELTSIIAPVSICMALVVVLVKALNPEGVTDSSAVAIATIAYHEQVGAAAAGAAGSTLLP
jgi:presenilin 1